MTDGFAPLSVGTTVTHINQQWATVSVVPDGTARIIDVRGPYPDGSFEYQVLAARDFSRQPGADNPMDRETWWSSNAVRAVKPPRVREVKRADLATEEVLAAVVEFKFWAFEHLAIRYPVKIVQAALDRDTRTGLLEYGVSAACPWITSLGVKRHKESKA